jgi:hypothetical protein
VGGRFEKAGGVPAKHIAVWDGAAWKPLGAGVDGSVDAITYYGGKITIGGAFENSGTDAVPHLAAWDGAKWTAIGGGLSTPGSTALVQGLAVHAGELYATGFLEQAGTLAVSHIARWNGTTWSTMEGGLNDVGEDVVATKDSLWVAGTFGTAGGRGSVAIGRYWFAP